MQTENGRNKKQPFGGLFGDSTPAKASGLAFSIAAILPTLLSIAFLLVIGAMGLTQNGEYQTENWYIYANYLLPQISFALVFFVYLYYAKTPLKKAVKAQKCRPIYFLIAVLLQIGLLSLSELNVWFLKLLSGIGYTDSGVTLPSVDGWGFVGVFIVVAIFAAATEEILFRGVLLEGLKNTFKTPIAVVLCGALFALYHQNPAQTLYQFCCGAAFSFVAIRAGSVLPTVLSHFLNNAYILILYKCGVTSFTTPFFIAIVSLSVVCLVGSLVWLFCLDKNVKKNTGEKEDKGSERKAFFLSAAVGVVVCAATWIFVLVSGL